LEKAGGAGDWLFLDSHEKRLLLIRAAGTGLDVQESGRRMKRKKRKRTKIQIVRPKRAAQGPMSAKI